MTSQNIILIAAVLHTVAVIIINTTKTPSDSTFLGKVYNLLEKFAGILTTVAKDEPDTPDTAEAGAKVAPSLKVGLVSLVLMLSAFALSGCSPKSNVIDAATVKADQDTFNSVVPVLKQAETDHPELSPDIENKLNTWQSRLNAENARFTASTQPSVK